MTAFSSYVALDKPLNFSFFFYEMGRMTSSS